MRSGAETAADTVVEERERGIGAGPTRPERWSGEARAARRGDPRRWRRALAERNVDAGRPEKARTSSRNGSCKESVPRAKNTHWVGQGC